MQQVPIHMAELEQMAAAAMKPQVAMYVNGSAGAGTTIVANQAAFRRYRLVPRMRAEASPKAVVNVAGTSLPSRYLLAPVGALTKVHPSGELAAAQAARRTASPMIVAATGSTPVAEVATALGETPWWWQMYLPRSARLRHSLMEQGLAAGAQALVVTLDVPVLAWRLEEFDAGWRGTRAQAMVNYLQDPVFHELCRGADPAVVWQEESIRPADWSEVQALCQASPVPVFAKGVLDPHEALRALDAGCRGVIVSNHGGRHLDNVKPSLDALPRVAAAIGGAAPILFDSGIRSGADALVALGLGATAVLLGRPWLWGLALGGMEGAETVMNGFQEDLALCLQVAGRYQVELEPGEI